MLIQGYSDFKFIVPNSILSNNTLSSLDTDKKQLRVWAASFKFDREISQIFPYINSTLDDAVYYENPEHIRFIFDGYRCFLYPDIAATGYFENKAAAKEFINSLIDFLNELHGRKENITPNYEKVRQISITDILKILPKTNCRKCGHTTCMSFAADVIMGKTTIDACPDLASPISVNAVYPVFDTSGNLVESVSLRMNKSPSKQPLSEEKPENYDSIQSSPKNSFGLTQREIEILKLIALGNTNNEIGSLLFISPHTVKSHMINIFNKLGVNDRTQAAVLATKKGII